MTPEQIEQIANVVLKSAGSGLCHYTPYSRERILKELTDHLEGYALVPIVPKEQALDAFNFIERKLSVGLDEMGHSEFADMDTHYAMSVLYRAALTRTSVGWMPIETCPDDNKHVLLAVPNWKKRLVYDPKNEQPDFIFEVRPYCLNGSGGAKSYHGLATHWMPLPAAPKAGE